MNAAQIQATNDAVKAATTTSMTPQQAIQVMDESTSHVQANRMVHHTNSRGDQDCHGVD